MFQTTNQIFAYVTCPTTHIGGVSNLKVGKIVFHMIPLTGLVEGNICTGFPMVFPMKYRGFPMVSYGFLWFPVPLKPILGGSVASMRTMVLEYLPNWVIGVKCI
jgi:hypothetical protein